MSAKNQHIIHRQILDLELGAGRSDADIREKYQDKFAGKMSEVMDSLFDQLVPGEEMLLIDKLEIDLGECSEENFLSIFRSRISEQLRKAFDKKKEKAGPGEGPAKKLSPVHRELECFIFFLEKGYFPWWADKIELADFERTLSKLLEKPDDKIKILLRSRLKWAYAPKRLSRQFSLRLNTLLLELMYPEITRNIQSILFKLPEVLNDIPGIRLSMSKHALETYVLESIWENLVEARLNERDYDIREKVISDIIIKNNLPAEDIINFLEDKMDVNPEEVEKLITEKEEKHTEKTEEQKKVKKSEEPEAEELLIENAGLVIVWPFLQEFYTKLDLVYGRTFKSEKLRERAVLLTQYMVTGETGIDEPQLVLNKIINGWPLKMPVEGKLEMNEKEKGIVQDLLKKLIENWPALKNTSPVALQETYLQRNGLLEQDKRSWNLKVERKTVDVLRDFLPWPINIISLPWMDTIIYVKW